MLPVFEIIVTIISISHASFYKIRTIKIPFEKQGQFGTHNNIAYVCISNLMPMI